MAGRIGSIVAYFKTNLTTFAAISFVLTSFLTSLYSLKKNNEHLPKWSLVVQNHTDYTEEVRLLETKLEKLEILMSNKIFSMAIASDLDPSHSPEPPRVNYLSYYIGALVIPYSTSPSANAGSRRIAWLWSFFGTRNANWKFRKPFTPANALAPWYEVGHDAFCGPPTRGVFQLAVILPRRIYPTEFVVEHWPRTEYPDIRAAPMDVELWIEVPDFYHRQILYDQMSRGTIMLSNHEPRQQGRILSAEDDLTKHGLWAPVGAFRYDVYADGHVQKYKIPERVREVISRMIPTNRVAVRVVSNWGDGNVTCLARVKLYGLQERRTEEKLDPPEGREGGVREKEEEEWKLVFEEYEKGY